MRIWISKITCCGLQIDSSNTPTEALDETEQGQGSANPNIEPIIISDESDSEDDSTVIATISLKRVRGRVEINEYVSVCWYSYMIFKNLFNVYHRCFLLFSE